MFPVLFRAGSVVVYTFGLMLFFAVFTGSFLVWKQARRKGLPEEQILDILLLVIFFAMIGGRLGFVLLNNQIFSSDFSRILLFARYPGFSYQFSIVSGVLAAIMLSKSFNFSGLMILDLFTIAFSWAAIFGFLGRVFERPAAMLPATLLMFLGSILAATTLAVGFKRINHDPELAILSRQHGLFFSSYLIFMSLLYLIFDGIVKGGGQKLYLAIFIPAVIFFIIRYRKALSMIKFPANILDQIKTYLEQKSKETEKRMRQLKKEDPFEDKTRLLDRASDDSEVQSKTRHERIEAMQKQMGFALAQTRKALTNIKIGKYGICESCGKMIDTDRLAVMPTATLCVSCMKKKEK